MQVYTPADQLLSPVEGEMDRETWRKCETALPAHLHTEPQRRCSALLSSALRTPQPGPHRYNTCLSRSLREGHAAGQIQRGKAARPTLQIWVVPDGHHVQCGCSSSPAWFESRLRYEEVGGCALYVSEEFIIGILFMSVPLGQHLSCTLLCLDEVTFYMLVACLTLCLLCYNWLFICAIF